MPIVLLITLPFQPFLLPITLLFDACCFAHHPAHCCLLFCLSRCLSGPIVSCDSSSATATPGTHPEGYSELYVAEARKMHVLDLH